MTAIEIRHLSFTYPDGHQALKGLNLAVERGECLGLVGPNGAGKSTLLLHLNGLIPSPNGAVRISGEVINKQSLPGVRQKVGLVFQNPDDQLFCPTLFEDVAFGPLNSQVPAGRSPEEWPRPSKKWGLEGFEQRSPHHLSVGEKRKASLATILSMDPEIIVLDEPSSNLDPRSRKELIRLLASFKETRIVATHDLEMVLQLVRPGGPDGPGNGGSPGPAGGDTQRRRAAEVPWAGTSRDPAVGPPGKTIRTGFPSEKLLLIPVLLDQPGIQTFRIIPTANGF